MNPRSKVLLGLLVVGLWVCNGCSNPVEPTEEPVVDTLTDSLVIQRPCNSCHAWNPVLQIIPDSNTE